MGYKYRLFYAIVIAVVRGGIFIGNPILRNLSIAGGILGIAVIYYKSRLYKSPPGIVHEPLDKISEYVFEFPKNIGYLIRMFILGIVIDFALKQ